MLEPFLVLSCPLSGLLCDKDDPDATETLHLLRTKWIVELLLLVSTNEVQSDPESVNTELEVASVT